MTVKTLDNCDDREKERQKNHLCGQIVAAEKKSSETE